MPALTETPLITVGLLFAVDNTFRFVFDAKAGAGTSSNSMWLPPLPAHRGLFALSNYSGFQSSYGLPLVQVFLKHHRCSHRPVRRPRSFRRGLAVTATCTRDGRIDQVPSVIACPLAVKP